MSNTDERSIQQVASSRFLNLEAVTMVALKLQKLPSVELYQIVPLSVSHYEVYFRMREEEVVRKDVPSFRTIQAWTAVPGRAFCKPKIDVTNGSPYNEKIQSFGRSSLSVRRPESDHQSA